MPTVFFKFVVLVNLVQYEKEFTDHKSIAIVPLEDGHHEDVPVGQKWRLL